MSKPGDAPRWPRCAPVERLRMLVTAGLKAKSDFRDSIRRQIVIILADLGLLEMRID